ncbi:hypothetical protein IAU59_005067 [Kwoniella sp. CBS 9459]
MAPTITLHHLNVSRSDRLFWLLEEVKLPYNVKVHFRLPTRQAPPSLHAVSPLGRAPTLELNGKTLTESAFIIHQILALPEAIEGAKNGSVDVEVNETEDSVFWSHFAEGSMMNLFQASAIIGATGQAWKGGAVGGLDEGGKEAVSKYSQWLTEGYLKPQIQGTIDLAESFITKQGKQWFSGTDKPGEGDFMMFFAINSLLAGTRKDAGYNVGTGLRGWYERVMARPAAKKGLERLKQEEESAKSKI